MLLLALLRWVVLATVVVVATCDSCASLIGWQRAAFLNFIPQKTPCSDSKPLTCSGTNNLLPFTFYTGLCGRGVDGQRLDVFNDTSRCEPLTNVAFCESMASMKDNSVLLGTAASLTCEKKTNGDVRAVASAVGQYVNFSVAILLSCAGDAAHSADYPMLDSDESFQYQFIWPHVDFCALPDTSVCSKEPPHNTQQPTPSPPTTPTTAVPPTPVPSTKTDSNSSSNSNNSNTNNQKCEERLTCSACVKATSFSHLFVNSCVWCPVSKENVGNGTCVDGSWRGPSSSATCTDEWKWAQCSTMSGSVVAYLLLGAIGAFVLCCCCCCIACYCRFCRSSSRQRNRQRRNGRGREDTMDAVSLLANDTLDSSDRTPITSEARAAMAKKWGIGAETGDLDDYEE